VSAPTRATSAGRAYLDLRKLAREHRRPVDELLQLYVLEAFLARLTGSRFADQLVLKGREDRDRDRERNRQHQVA
jgi:hypothetical protein